MLLILVTSQLIICKSLLMLFSYEKNLQKMILIQYSNNVSYSVLEKINLFSIISRITYITTMYGV